MIFALGLDGSACAMEPPLDWFAHDFGSTSVFARFTAGSEETLLMDGVLKFAYPQGFQIQYYTMKAPMTITSQDGFVEVQTGSDVQYGYDRYWLFEDIQNHLFGLVEFSRIPLEFSGMDEVAGRTAKRYAAATNSRLLLWFDEQSGLPFLIRQGSKTLVVVTSYTLDSQEPHNLTALELETFFTEEPAKITLDHGLQGWVPSRLVVAEELGEVTVDFSNWSLTNEWVNSPLPKLARLRELNECFLEHFDAKDWELALSTSQEILTLAPQFWQVYLYQAFAYEGLDNFLGVVENYQQVLMRQPDNHLALNNLAYHYFLREVQIPQALEMAERAVALNRRDIYLDTLGYGYYLAGRYAEAKELLLEALTTAPEEAVAEITEHLDLVLEALAESESAERE